MCAEIVRVAALSACAGACHLLRYMMLDTWHSHTDPHRNLGGGAETAWPLCTIRGLQTFFYLQICFSPTC